MVGKRVAKSGKSEPGSRAASSASGAGNVQRNGKTKKAVAPKATQARSILLIAGMHRSGTSALTRILNLRGISLPGELLDPAIDNPTGFWENKRIIAFHNALFEAFGAHFEDVLALPEDWFKSASAQAAIEDLRTIISEEYASDPISITKDPRICRVLPLWYAALEPLDIQPKTIIPIRYPFDVAASLQARNQISLVHGLLSWLDHVTSAEFDSRGRIRSIVSFDALISDWRGATDKIARDLGIVFPKSAKQSISDVAGFLKSDLVHHSKESTDADPQIASMALDAWNCLRQLATDQSDTAAQAQLDMIRVEFARAARPLADVAKPLEQKAREAIAVVVAADRTRREWYEPQIARLEKAVAEQDNIKRTWFEPELEQRDKQIVVLKTEIDRLASASAAYEKAKTEWFEPQLEQRTAELSSLKEQIAGVQAQLEERDRQTIEMKATVARMAAQSREDEQTRAAWFDQVAAQHAEQAAKLTLQIAHLTKMASESGRNQDVINRIIEELTVERHKAEEELRLEVDRLRAELANSQGQTADALKSVSRLTLAVQSPVGSQLAQSIGSREVGKVAPNPSTTAIGGSQAFRRLARQAGRQLRDLAGGNSDRKLIDASGLFDENWYRQQVPDLGGADPLAHYLKRGAATRVSPSPGFDAEWYLSTNPDVAKAGVNPLAHYLRFGIAEGRRPRPSSPDFPSNLTPPIDLTPIQADAIRQGDRALLMRSSLFDAEWYREKYPDIQGMDLLDHYLDYGGIEGRWPSPHFNGSKYLAFNPDIMAARLNPLVHYLRSGRKEGRQAGLPMRIQSTITSTIEELRAIEPQIAGEAAFVNPDWLHNHESYKPLALNAAWAKIFSSLKRPYDYIIFIPWFVRGGAEQEAAYVARMVIDKLGPHSVLVVATTNERREGIDWFPETADKLILSDVEPNLTHEDRVRLVEMLIYAIRPKAVLNENSHALWDAIARRGVALSNISDLYAMIFCKDYGPDGRPGGYLDSHFRGCLRHLKRVYSDNSTIIDELAEELSLTSAMRDKLAFVPQPIDANVKRRGYVLSRDNERMPVIWSGRFARQKHIDMLVEIIERSPDIQFDVYGSGDAPYQQMLESLAARVDNVSLKGAFASFETLPIENYAAYLFTSLWEGMPNTIISAAASGIPVVAADAGGIRELINADTGWLVQPDDLEAHLEALEEIRQNPEEAKRRVENLVKLVNKRHSWRSYAKAMATAPSFLD